MSRAVVALLSLAALGACKHSSGPGCPTVIPSTQLYEIYCDKNDQTFCLWPEMQEI